MRQEVTATWGGARQGSGRKHKWNHRELKVVKIPTEILEEVLMYARILDGSSEQGLKVENVLCAEIQTSSELAAIKQVLDKEVDALNELSINYNKLERDYLQLKLEHKLLLEKSTPEKVTLSSHLPDLQRAANTLKQIDRLDARSGKAIKSGCKEALKVLTQLLAEVR